MSGIEPNAAGAQLIKDWEAAVERHTKAKTELDRAEAELNRTIGALVIWLVPPNADYFERFAIAYGRDFIEVQRIRGTPIGKVTRRDQGEIMK